MALPDTTSSSTYEEYSAFTGTDIKAFILPQGDRASREFLREKLFGIERAFQKKQNADALNFANNLLNGDLIAKEQERLLLNGAPVEPVVPLVNMQSITISTFRAKNQVRALGHVNARGLARGSRTVAGTLILTELGKDAFWEILMAPSADQNIGDGGVVKPDQMRPFDIMLMFANELGNIAIRHIYGLEVVTNGTVYSIQDNTVSYIAVDVSPLIPLGNILSGAPHDSQGTAKKLNSLITSLRPEDLLDEMAYLRKSRSPFK
jgi:hypothetical protein